MNKVLLTLTILFSAAKLNAQDSLMLIAESSFDSGEYEAAYADFKQAGNFFFEKERFSDYVESHIRMVDCKVQSGDPFMAKSLARTRWSLLKRSFHQTN